MYPSHTQRTRVLFKLDGRIPLRHQDLDQIHWCQIDGGGFGFWNFVQMMISCKSIASSWTNLYPNVKVFKANVVRHLKTVLLIRSNKFTEWVSPEWNSLLYAFLCHKRKSSEKFVLQFTKIETNPKLLFVFKYGKSNLNFTFVASWTHNEMWDFHFLYKQQFIFSKNLADAMIITLNQERFAFAKSSKIFRTTQRNSLANSNP